MSDSEEERLNKIIEESKITIENAEAKLEEHLKVKLETKIADLKLSVDDQFERESEILEEVKNLQEKYYGVNKEIIESLEKIKKLEVEMQDKCSSLKILKNSFVEESKNRIQLNYDKWSKLSEEKKKKLWSTIFISGRYLYLKFYILFMIKVRLETMQNLLKRLKPEL